MESIGNLNAKVESRPLKKNNSYVMLRQPTDTTFRNMESSEKSYHKKYEYAFPQEEDRLKTSSKERIKSYN